MLSSMGKNLIFPGLAKNPIKNTPLMGYLKFGRGGQSYIARILSCSRNTVRKGAIEVSGLSSLEVRKQIGESRELSDDVKAKVGEVYDKAITQLISAAEFESKKLQYTQTRMDVPNTLVKTKDVLAQQATIAPPEAGPQTTLAQAEQALATARLTLEEAKKNVANWENEPKRRAERRTKIPEESNSAIQKLSEIDAQLAAPAPEGQATELTQATRALLLAQRRALESQIAGNTEELLFYDAATELLAARRDLAAR